MASTAAASADHDTEGWYLARSAILNRCNLSPWALASQHFQADPRPIEIAWVRQEHGDLLALLAGIADPAERAACFHDYALRRFWLHEDPATWPDQAERQRRSYAAVLRGWGIDSSGASGAVLKGWAENRFGLRAIWHGAALDEADADPRYAAERMRGALSGIGQQLDLLYTYAQDELRRRHGAERWLTLYRGTHDPEAYLVKQPTGLGREQLVEFNSVSSFTADAETAWEFGSLVWRVRVPLAKVVYATGLLGGQLLQGESEHIVLGGDYLVTPLRC
jgi:NAD+--dinitrogen-reductase ADP-D-ribosyltransferase